MRLTDICEEGKTEIALWIAETTLKNIADKNEDYNYCKKSIEICRDWLKTRQVSKVSIAERVSNDVRSLASLVIDTEDIELANQYGAILICVSYIAWQAYNYEQDYFYPQDLEGVDDEYLEELINDLIEENVISYGDYENKLKYVDRMNINSFGGTTLEAVNNFENIIGFLLPEDYKQFLIEYNGGTSKVRYSTFKVEGLESRIPLDVLYGIDVGKRHFDLRYTNEAYKDDILPGSIIIGDEPGGGFWVLMDCRDYKGVYYWDSPYYFEQSDEENNLYKAADSFSDFIKGVMDGK